MFLELIRFEKIIKRERGHGVSVPIAPRCRLYVNEIGNQGPRRPRNRLKSYHLSKAAEFCTGVA